MKKNLLLLTLFISLLTLSCKKDSTKSGFVVKASSNSKYTISVLVQRPQTDGLQTIENTNEQDRTGAFEFVSNNAKAGDSFYVKITGERGQPVKLEVTYNKVGKNINYTTVSDFPVGIATGNLE